MKRVKKVCIHEVFIVSILFYFLQVFPYVHIHHSHDDSVLPIEFSLHPIDVDADHLPEHHGHSDQHHDDENQCKWFLTRSSVQRIEFHLESSELPVVIEHDLIFTKSRLQFVREELVLLKSLQIEPHDTRAPPTLS